MDSLNGLVYVDDKQVVSLNAIKVMDSKGLCRGATELEISVLGEEDLYHQEECMAVFEYSSIEEAIGSANLLFSD